jgi:hypothetical protein
MVMSVLWAQKSAGMKWKYSLTATINPYRRKKEEGGRKSRVRMVNVMGGGNEPERRQLIIFPLLDSCG